MLSKVQFHEACAFAIRHGHHVRLADVDNTCRFKLGCSKPAGNQGFRCHHTKNGVERPSFCQTCYSDAAVRLPASTGQAERLEIVANAIEVLGLGDVRHAVIGDEEVSNSCASGRHCLMPSLQKLSAWR